MKPWTVIIEDDRRVFTSALLYTHYDTVPAWKEAGRKFCLEGTVVAIIPGNHHKEVFTGTGWAGNSHTKVLVEEY
jgi:hypothetical protein|tara:strand:- start:279 stop:503 length:225 start_codon:yes stop_codon:yes gene_type:complete